jgi:hypothetical protein
MVILVVIVVVREPFELVQWLIVEVRVESLSDEGDLMSDLLHSRSSSRVWVDHHCVSLLP